MEDQDPGFDINTAQELWELYGGQRGAANALGVSQPAVGAYTTRGITPGWVGRLICDLVIARKTFDPALFELHQHPGAYVLNALIAEERERERRKR